MAHLKIVAVGSPLACWCMKKRRRGSVDEKHVGDGLSHTQRCASLLRDLQWQTNCSTYVLQTFLDLLNGRLGECLKQCDISGEEVPRSITCADTLMQKTV